MIWGSGPTAHYAYNSGVQNLEHVDLGELCSTDMGGHTGDRVELTANGLRQGCTLSPILYLVVIIVLVSKEPNVGMPDWDEGYRA